MFVAVRRGVVVTAAVAALVLPAGSPVTAAPAAPANPTAVGAAAALPSYETWLADVAVVTDTARAYLAGRLPDPRIRAAVVLDIDNTALVEKYNTSGLLQPATEPVLALARQARAAGASVLFVTNRPEIIQPWTEYNLKSAGYVIDGIHTRATFNFDPVEKHKAQARIAIERRGFTIVANIGNNDTDLVGGHAERTFKLPDYDGALS